MSRRSAFFILNLSFFILNSSFSLFMLKLSKKRSIFAKVTTNDFLDSKTQPNHE